ncbi:hypothetical protein CBS147332_2130 [Penicillium roqueforti]|nr:hypothetical protein LCP963914a_6447 [Penicillium roqueforti]KAI2699165.1 hypothetical protein CBS147372_6412 [Penicillium roqueforti]KAI2730278.1 hypothetical protein CBS147332_2130 [Penicillium roqueforti]KAI2753686.1 hypothetical protein DTO013F2_2648 [Penicillium roqueforti]KAI3107037.1 hypothetical protein CBS147331_6343 [Penicillium roqueforti]
MKFFKVVLVVALAAFANAAAVPNPEAALDTNPLEKRCRSTRAFSLAIAVPVCVLKVVPSTSSLSTALKNLCLLDMLYTGLGI